MSSPSIDVRERFETLLNPVLDLAYRVAFRLTGNREAALDLVQDATILAFRSFQQFEDGTNFRAWFLRIVTNRFYRSRQREQRLPTVTIDEAPDLFLYTQAKSANVPLEGDPAAAFVAQMDGEAIQAALQKLPDDYRQVAVLNLVGEMSYEQIAETLDIPVGTVRSRLHRARKQLQVLLHRVAEERGLLPNPS